MSCASTEPLIYPPTHLLIHQPTGATVLVAPSLHALNQHQDNDDASPPPSTSRKKQIKIRRATLADVDAAAQTVDVLYDEEEGEEEEEEEEDNVPTARVFPLAADAPVEQSKVLLNMARCLLKSHLGRLWEALVRLSLVVTLLAPIVLARDEDEEKAREDEEEKEKEKEEATRLLVSAYECRCKALCRGGDFKLAKLDARRILQVAAARGEGRRRGGLTAAALKEKVKGLAAGIEREAKRREVLDKRLVKSMSQWINVAMESGSAGGGAAGGGGQEGPGPAVQEEEGKEGCCVG